MSMMCFELTSGRYDALVHGVHVQTRAWVLIEEWVLIKNLKGFHLSPNMLMSHDIPIVMYGRTKGAIT